VLLVDLTWDIPESTHGNIRNYMVEYINNAISTPATKDIISVCTHISYY